MADAFAHASGMAQSHANVSQSGKEVADLYIKAAQKPPFDTLYPPQNPRVLHVFPRCLNIVCSAHIAHA